MFWDYGGPKAGKAGSAGAGTKANGAVQKPNGVQADGAFGTTMSPDFRVRRVGTLLHCCCHACPTWFTNACKAAHIRDSQNALLLCCYHHSVPAMLTHAQGPS